MNPFAIIRWLASSTLLALSLVAGQAAANPYPLLVQVFVHQDVRESTESLEYNYLAHWAKNMKKITGREVSFEYITEANGITTMDYKQNDLSATLEAVSTLSFQYSDTYERERDGVLQWQLLLTRDPLHGSTGGIAQERGSRIAIASLQAYNIPAHELGHMLGATHDDAEAGWCDTYMVSTRNSLKAQCYRYSEANEQRIAQYFKNRR